MQFESIDNELLNGLWNIIKTQIFNRIPKYENYLSDTDFNNFYTYLWHFHLKLPVDRIPNHDHLVENDIRFYFYQWEWYKVYDLIEFFANLKFEYLDIYNYTYAVNEILQREFSAYRLIEGKISPITNEVEIMEIEESFNLASNYTSLQGVNIHLYNALEKFSDRNSPDFRNSIKESISAIETACRIITNESTLGSALTKLESKGIKINNQLKDGLVKIYAYTNSKNSGIRHGYIEKIEKPDFHDAKFMLIFSSSLINFFIGKCIQSGITLA